ncbi:hypothetical protein VTK26DRAFT_8732 [Humicola hyalothermophila]
MADQCIVCLEPLAVQAEDAPTPPAPANQQLLNELEEHHKRLAIEDPDGFAKLNKSDKTPAVNREHVAEISTCGHVLHDACLSEWTEKANSCPICRQTFNVVTVREKVGGKYLSTRRVEDKKQVAEFDPRAWVGDNVEIPDDSDVPGNPCPVCNSADHEDVLLLCEGCDAAYHTHCIGLDEIPRGAWFCMECVDAFGPEIMEPLEGAGNDRSPLGRPYYFPRTRARMRRARRQAQSDEWRGAWGHISGRIFDAIALDLDYHDDEEDSEILEGIHRSRQLREEERRDYARWLQRLNIASRLGARDVFANNIRPAIHSRPRAPSPPRESREEQLAWGAFERARETEAQTESRKRKSHSVTDEPQEEPHPEAERKLKRPRTRRLPPQNGESSSSAKEQAGPSSRRDHGGPSTNGSEAPPSFLASLLKEVEMSTGSDDEGLRNMYGIIPGVHDAPSPAPSPSILSEGSITPPPACTPRTWLSTHIEPVYPRTCYSPTGASSPSSLHRSRASSPTMPIQRDGRSSPENSDSEQHRSRGRRPGDHHGALELRQPRPRRTQTAQLPRSHHTSPSRSPLPLEMKESISKIVRGALKPHWRSKQLTPEQYETINRDISRKIYEEVTDPATVNDAMKQGWEKMATQEVARAVASLQACV